MPFDDTPQNELCKLERLFVSMLSKDGLPVQSPDVIAEDCAPNQQCPSKRSITLEFGVGHCDHGTQACLKEGLVDKAIEEVMHPRLVPHQPKYGSYPFVLVLFGHSFVVN